MARAVEHQNRISDVFEYMPTAAEFEAFTNGAEIPTGAEVRVVRMSGARSFEVASLQQEETA